MSIFGRLLRSGMRRLGSFTNSGEVVTLVPTNKELEPILLPHAILDDQRTKPNVDGEFAATHSHETRRAIRVDVEDLDGYAPTILDAITIDGQAFSIVEETSRSETFIVFELLQQTPFETSAKNARKKRV